MSGAGAAIVISILAIGFVLRRGLIGSEPTVVRPISRREGRLYDSAAERDAFMKRYGGVS